MTVVLIVSGPPGTGKTTLARRLASDLGWPLVAKDDVKEALADTLGIRDLAWSRRLGRAAWELVYRELGLVLAAGGSVVAEGNFHSSTSRPFVVALLDRFGAHPVEIHCRAPGPVRRRRAQERWELGERHRVHVEPADFSGYLLDGPDADPMSLGGPLLEVDTTDGVDSEGALAWVRATLDVEPPPE